MRSFVEHMYCRILVVEVARMVEEERVGLERSEDVVPNAPSLVDMVVHSWILKLTQGK